MVGQIRTAAEDVLVREKATGKVFEIDRPSLKRNPERYDVIHKKFVAPTPEEIAEARRKAPLTTWRAPDLGEEFAEIERTAKMVGMPALDVVWKAATEGKLLTLDDTSWSTMANTDSWETDSIEKAVYHAWLYDKDIRSILKVLGANLAAPIVVRRQDGSLQLVGGNTRLMTFRALGVRPKVLLVNLMDRTETRMASEVEAFQQALTVRNVMVRFAKAKEKTSLAIDDLFKGRSLMQARRMVENLSKLADRAEQFYEEIEMIPPDARAVTEDKLGEKIFEFLDRALSLAHKLAGMFDDLSSVYHTLGQSEEKLYRPVFERHFELNTVYQRANKRALSREDLASVPGDVHALYMAASALVSQYSTALRHTQVNGLGE
jgi:hypothetical protein